MKVLALDRREEAALVEAARRGGSSCAEAAELVGLVTPLIRSKARGFASNEDDVLEYIQEGMIGFVQALRTWREDGGASFSTYACVCAVNRMRSLYRKRALPGGISLVSIEDSQAAEIPDASADLPAMQESDESLKELLRAINEKLSPFERAVLDSYLAGKSYAAVAEGLGTSAKSVDNAVQRIRRKLSAFRPGRAGGSQ